MFETCERLFCNSLKQINRNRVKGALLHIVVKVKVHHLCHDQKVASEEEAVVDCQETVFFWVQVRYLIKNFGFDLGIFRISVPLLTNLDCHDSTILLHISTSKNLAKGARP